MRSQNVTISSFEVRHQKLRNCAVLLAEWILGIERFCRISVLLVTFLVSACAITPRPGELAARRAQTAKEYIAQSEWYFAYMVINRDLTSTDPEINKSARDLVQSIPNFYGLVLEELETSIPKVNTAEGAKFLGDRIYLLPTNDLFDAVQLKNLRNTFDNALRSANLEEKIPFLLNDPMASYSALQEPSQAKIIFDRSIRSLVENPTYPSYTHGELRNKIFAYVKMQGPDSEAHRQLAEIVDHLQIPVSDLKGIVRELYPEYAARKLAALNVEIYLTTDPPKRLLEEDLMTAFRRRSELLRVERADRPGALKILVRELQFEGRQTPERTRTIVVDYSDVGIVLAVLALPRGASVLFDYTEGGAEIELAYEVIAEKDGQKIFEKLLRDKIGRQFHQCSNMRAHNVFGGVSGFSYYPNQRVQQLCESGSQRVHVSDLRGEVLDRLIAIITSIPPIAEAIKRSN